MKLGIKIFSEKKILDYFKNKADFFEIMAIESNNYDFLKEFNKPTVIHAQHAQFNVNNSDKTKKEINLSSINFARKIADFTDSKKIILHPGELENDNCSEKNSIEFFKSITDKRILVENMPMSGIPRPCMTPEETKKFIKETKAGFCLDINHAIDSAIVLKTSYIEFLKEFIKLKPKHYHFGGQKIKGLKDHLSLRDSDFNLGEVISLLPKNAEITLEVTNNIKNLEDDIRIMGEIIKEIEN